MKKKITQFILFTIILYLLLSLFDYLQRVEIDWVMNIWQALLFVVLIRIFLGMDSLFKKIKWKKKDIKK